MEYESESNVNSNSSKEEATIDKLTKVGREATKFDFETLKVSSDCKNGSKNLKEELLNKVLMYDLPHFYSTRLSEKRSCFKKIQYETFMKYSRNSISEPILIMPPELHDTAVSLFDDLQSYINNKDALNKLKTHLRKCFNEVEDIKDEAYIQVIKQINDNPERYSI